MLGGAIGLLGGPLGLFLAGVLGAGIGSGLDAKEKQLVEAFNGSQA